MLQTVSQVLMFNVCATNAPTRKLELDLRMSHADICAAVVEYFQTDLDCLELFKVRGTFLKDTISTALPITVEFFRI